MIVLDASAMVELLLASRHAVSVRAAIGAERMHVPELLDVEVLQVLRRFHRRGELTPDEVESALDELLLMRVRRHSHVALLSRAWELAGNVTAYDACYLVLAEELGARLVTCDAKLAGVPGCRAEVDVVG